MIRWIEIRDQLPPTHFQVLFYIRNEFDGYTEDYCVQGCIISVENEGDYAQKVSYQLNSILDEHEKVSYWTLLPEPPTPWR